MSGPDGRAPGGGEPSAPPVLVVQPGEGAGPVRWDMSLEDLVATLGPPTDRRRSPGAPDRLTWAGAWPGETGELVVEADDSGLVSLVVEGCVVQVDGRVHDLRDPDVLDALDPVLHDGAHVFRDWGVALWGIEPQESSVLWALAPGPADELRAAAAGAPRYTQLRATARALPTAAQPWVLRPGEGLGPLSFGMTQAQVGDLLGPAAKDAVIQGRPREVRGNLVCVFDRDGGLVEIRWAGLRAVELDGGSLAGRGRGKPHPALTRTAPLVNRSWDVHLDLGLAIERDGGGRREVVVFDTPRASVWTNLRRPLL